MKKMIRYFSLGGIVAALMAIAAAFWHQGTGQAARPNHENHHPQAPAKMIEMGPVGTDIVSSEQIGNVLVRMTARRMWFKKSKTFGFDNALLKKMAASDFRLTVSKAGKVILSLSKDLVEMPLDRSVITIHEPEILFPRNIGQPDILRFDKSSLRVSFRQGASENTWELSEDPIENPRVP
jgi:hypothetical protein